MLQFLARHLAHGASQHSLVEGNHQRLGSPGVKQRAVHVAEAEHNAVTWRFADQLFQRAPPPLGGHHERAIFDEAAGVAQGVHVLARGAVALGMATRDHVHALMVQHALLPLQQLGQVGADGVQVERFGLHPRKAGTLVHHNAGQHLAHHYTGPGRREQVAHHATHRRVDHMLHLHRFDDGYGLPGHHVLARLHEQLDHRSIQKAGAGRHAIGQHGERR